MCDRSGVRALVGRGDVACRPWGVGPGMPACNRPMRGIRYGGCGIWPGNRKSLEVALQHRPHSHGTRCRPEAAVFAGGYPIGPEPNVVRIAPLHDAGIPLARERQGGDGLLCGESYTLMHPRSPAPVMPCNPKGSRSGRYVPYLFSFVKRNRGVRLLCRPGHARIIHPLKIIDEPGSGRGPLQLRPGPGAGSRQVQTGEHREPAEMLRRFLRRHRNHRQA